MVILMVEYTSFSTDPLQTPKPPLSLFLTMDISSSFSEQNLFYDL